VNSRATDDSITLSNRFNVWTHVGTIRPSLWSSGQSSWLQPQRSWFDSRRYQIFWEVVGLKRCPLSLVSNTKKLLERKSSGSGIDIREYGHRDPSRWPRDTPYPQNFALTSLTSGGRSVGIVRTWTQARSLFLVLLVPFPCMVYFPLHSWPTSLIFAV
jgi:hypothetical protein